MPGSVSALDHRVWKSGHPVRRRMVCGRLAPSGALVDKESCADSYPRTSRVPIADLAPEQAPTVIAAHVGKSASPTVSMSVLVTARDHSESLGGVPAPDWRQLTASALQSWCHP